MNKGNVEYCKILPSSKIIINVKIRIMFNKFSFPNDIFYVTTMEII